MDVLSCRPNILFPIWVRNQNIHFLLNKKLRRPIYSIKLINALTTIENGIKFGLQCKTWKIKNKKYREDGPAYIIGISNDNPNGTNHEYYMNDELHRDDGPAFIKGISKNNPNGTYHAYFRNDQRHRYDGPARIEGISNDNPNGTRHEYYMNDELHRDDGPAIIRGISKDNPNGTSNSYYMNGIQVEPL